ncbi:MAG TPA: S8 family peptidase, partial [Pyrinomonadaceae bacterium]
MKSIKRPPFIKVLTTLSLLVLAAAGIMLGDVARAQTAVTLGDKVSADVRQKAKTAKGTDKINLIVQSNSKWSSTLTSNVNGNGGSISRSFTNFNARLVSLPVTAIDALANNSEVRFISLDRELKQLGHVTLTTGADAARTMSTPGITLDGSGIGIAILDSGIDPNHVAFNDSNNLQRIIVNKDFTGELNASGVAITSDPYGHGTHVASIAAGNGAVAQGAYTGIAPAAKIINLRVLDSQGRGTASGLMAALDWLLSNRALYNIRVVNMSLGTAAIDSYKIDPLCVAVRRLVDAGIVVVAAAGNQGKNSSGQKVYGLIHSPGNEPSVITVGAANTYGTSSRGDDTIATYSSRGPTRSFWTDLSGLKHYDNLLKPDMVAPGNKIIDAEAEGNYLVTNNPSLDAGVSSSSIRAQMYMSGTSMATPAVAGAAALLLQANPQLTPNVVKAILMYTAQPLAGFNHYEQGAGELNLEGAVRLARLIRADINSASLQVGDPLLCATCLAPLPKTTIGGQTFTWGQGLIAGKTFATGPSLITRYQKVYGLGVLLGDGAVEGNGVLIGDRTWFSDGVVLGDNILTSNGVMLGDGLFFCSTGV